MTKKTLEHTFNVETPARVHISNVRGLIDIRRGDDDKVVVSAIKYLDSGDADQTKIEIVQESDGLVRVETRQRARGFWRFLGWSTRPCRVDYTLHVPHQCTLKVVCVASSAKIDGLEGEFRFKTISGNIRLSDLSGKIDLSSISGEVDAEYLSGPVHLDTISGDVHITQSRLPSFKAATKSGDITLETTIGAGPYRFKSISGDVNLIVPANTRCEIDFNSLSGDLKSHLPQHIALGEVQVNSASIRFNSISGDLQIDPSDQLAEFDLNLAEARRELLERIDRGELPVDEALGKLSAIRR